MNVKVCVDSAARARSCLLLPALVKLSGGAFLMLSSRPSSAHTPHSLVLRCLCDGLCGSCPLREEPGSSPRSLPAVPSEAAHAASIISVVKGWDSHTGIQPHCKRMQLSYVSWPHVHSPCVPLAASPGS